MTITVNNQQVEAYDLLMKKEFAMEILQGKKTIEFRSFTDHYITRFMDRSVIQRNRDNNRDMNDPEFENEFNDIWYIHFHNYNNSWYLDVAIETIGMCIVDSYDINRLMQEYPGFAELQEDARKNDELPDDEKPMVFYLVLAEIVGTNLN